MRKQRITRRIVIRGSRDEFLYQFSEPEWESEAGRQLTTQLNQLLYQLSVPNVVARYEEFDDTCV